MKKLTLALIPLFAASSAFAQRIQIGINLGGSYTEPGTPSRYYSTYDNYHRQGELSPFCSLSAAYNTKHMQYGLQVVSTDFRYTFSYDAMYGPTVLHENGESWVAGEAYPPVKMFANRTFNMHHLQFYTGLSAGYIAFHHDTYVHNKGWIAGLQGGGTWLFTKHWGLNLDIQCTYIKILYRSDYVKMGYGLEYANTSESVFNFPASLGVHYRFLK